MKLHDFQLTRLGDLAVPPVYARALEALEDLGFRDAVLYGGALRDAHLGIAPHDLDVRVNNKVFEHTTEACLRAARHFDVTRVEMRCMGGITVQARVYATFEGCGLDIMAAPFRFTASELCARADAPLNGIAMTSGGDLHAHPQFEDDAAARIYAPAQRTAVNDARFLKLSAKINGLRYMPGAV